jgi:hypothetical protein
VLIVCDKKNIYNNAFQYKQKNNTDTFNININTNQNLTEVKNMIVRNYYENNENNENITIFNLKSDQNNQQPTIPIQNTQLPTIPIENNQQTNNNNKNKNTKPRFIKPSPKKTPQ